MNAVGQICRSRACQVSESWMCLRTVEVGFQSARVDFASPGPPGATSVVCYVRRDNSQALHVAQLELDSYIADMQRLHANRILSSLRAAPNAFLSLLG